MSDEAPYLPRPDAPAPKTKTNGRRTLLLWLILILGCVAIYWLVEPSPGHHRAPPPPREDEGSWGFVTWLITGTIAASLGWCVLWVRRMNAVSPFINDAVKRLQKGEVDEAERAFEDLARRYRWPGAVVTMIRFNRASCAVRRGDFARAIALYEQVFKWFGWGARAVRQGTYVELPACGHFPTLEYPDDSTALITAWLRGIDGA